MWQVRGERRKQRRGVASSHVRSESGHQWFPHANEFADVSLVTGIGHARNLAVVASGDVVIAVGGEWGTLSEIGLAGVLSRPVVLLTGGRLEHTTALPGHVHYTESAEEAVELAIRAVPSEP